MVTSHQTENPFAAYTGEGGYVFVCYAHADTDVVYQDMKALCSKGLRIWYDEGISPGSEWNEELGHALINASMVLFYASTSSIVSRNCRDEINFAHNHDRPVLVNYLEEVELPLGLELSLSATQAIHKFKLGNEDYMRKVMSVIPADAFETELRDDSISRDIVKRKPLSSKFAAVFAALVVLVAGVFLVFDTNYWIARLMIYGYEIVGTPIEQQIGFTQTKDNVRIAYAVTGQGPPVVHSIGWGTDLKNGISSPTYDAFGAIALTSESHTYIRYDGRGFGMSDRNVTDYSLAARVADLAAVIDASGFETVNIIGSSAGGYTAIAYTAQYPERVNSLVLAGTGVDYEHRSESEMIKFNKILDVVELSWDRMAVRSLLVDSMMRSEPSIFSEMGVEFLMRAGDGPAYAGFLRAQVNLDVKPYAQAITRPTFVLHARDDRTFPIETGSKLASMISGAKFEVIDGGHGEGSGSTLEARQIILDYIDSHR